MTRLMVPLTDRIGRYWWFSKVRADGVAGWRGGSRSIDRSVDGWMDAMQSVQAVIPAACLLCVAVSQSQCCGVAVLRCCLAATFAAAAYCCCCCRPGKHSE